MAMTINTQSTSNLINTNYISNQMSSSRTVQPMSVAEDVETIVQGALQFLVNTSTPVSMETRGPGMCMYYIISSTWT